MSEYRGCGSHSCIIERPKGIGNNGPCRCADWRGQREIMRLRDEVERYKEIADEFARQLHLIIAANSLDRATGTRTTLTERVLNDAKKTLYAIKGEDDYQDNTIRDEE